jgi:small subunit ribosomal protein S16
MFFIKILERNCMAVRLRLARVGRKKLPFFRIVAVDSRKARDGEALDILGTYSALTGECINVNVEKIDAWIKNGAQMLDSVKKIYKKVKKTSVVS